MTYRHTNILSNIKGFHLIVVWGLLASCCISKPQIILEESLNYELKGIDSNSYRIDTFENGYIMIVSHKKKCPCEGIRYKDTIFYYSDSIAIKKNDKISSYYSSWPDSIYIELKFTQFHENGILGLSGGYECSYILSLDDSEEDLIVGYTELLPVGYWIYYDKNANLKKIIYYRSDGDYKIIMQNGD